MKLAAVCIRAGISPTIGNRAILAALRGHGGRLPDAPWAMEVALDGQRYVVGQGDDPRFFVVFPLPFAGWTDEFKIVPPLDRAADLLPHL